MHTHTRPPRYLTALTHLRALFQGPANQIVLCARNPHRPGNHEVIWVEQAASVVVPKLLLWRDIESERERERERDRDTYLYTGSSLNGRAELK